mmetsp:Transcript_41764/g.55028  ORF Transcript_41764/g.55028 Transcript_41764/m.55028 type:complete len:292 (+) Transcript_41764:692-1567(+)
MAEHLLVLRNKQNAKPVTMVMIRPSIVGAAESEPMPGWTDTQGLLSGIALAMGLGVLKDMPGNPDGCIDVIPVDYIARQVLVGIAYATLNPKCQGKEGAFIVQSATSATNPVTYGKFFRTMTKYQNNFPYEKRAGPASITIHRNSQKYERTFKLRSQVPTQVLYYMTRVLATRQLASDVKELKEGVESVRLANITFAHYTYNEWVFDNANSMRLDAYVKSSRSPPELIQAFAVNVKQIDWHAFAMNHAYGVKHYVLKEEAVIPSHGYGDALVHLKSFGVRDWAPWTEKVNW